MSGVETKAAESVHVRVCAVGNERCGGAGGASAGGVRPRRGPPLLCARGAPVQLGFRRVLPRGFASISRRGGPALYPRAGHVAAAHLLAKPFFFTHTLLQNTRHFQRFT